MNESHISRPENQQKKEPFFDKVKKLGMPFAISALVGCHPSPISPKTEGLGQETQAERMIEIPNQRNRYEEPKFDLFSVPETEDAKSYQSAAFKHFTQHPDYQKVKDGTLKFDEDIIDLSEDNSIHLSPQSLSLWIAFVVSKLHPEFYFYTMSQKKGSWNSNTRLFDIQKAFGIPDSRGVLNTETLHAIDATWKAYEDTCREANKQWKQICEEENIESRIVDTTGVPTLDALVTLADRAYQKTAITAVPQHLRKYAAGEGNVFLFTKDTAPFYGTIFSSEDGYKGTYIHELGHNIFGFGLQGGKNKKINEKFPGGAYGDSALKGADLMPFFYTAFGGRKIPASYVDYDMTEGIINRFEDSPMNEFDTISWNFLMKTKQDGLKGKYFVGDDIEKTGKDQFVSGYAFSNSMEDEAETFRIVVLHPEQEKRGIEIAGADSDLAKKFAFMHKILDESTFKAWQENNF